MTLTASQTPSATFTLTPSMTLTASLTPVTPTLTASFTPFPSDTPSQ
jgi:hypothetical protein